MLNYQRVYLRRVFVVEVRAGPAGTTAISALAAEVRWRWRGTLVRTHHYPLVNVYIAIENHQFYWENSL